MHTLYSKLKKKIEKNKGIKINSKKNESKFI